MAFLSEPQQRHCSVSLFLLGSSESLAPSVFATTAIMVVLHYSTVREVQKIEEDQNQGSAERQQDRALSCALSTFSDAPCLRLYE